MVGLTILVTVIALTAVLIVLFRRLASRLNAQDCSLEWLENFSTANYVPIHRLFNEQDFRFLATQPGYQPDIARQLRADRREIVAAYLQWLTRDFNQLLAIAKMMLVHSNEDRPGFGGALLWQQITFYYAVTSLRCRLALAPMGWTVPDIRKLIQPIESMLSQLQRPAAQTNDAA